MKKILCKLGFHSWVTAYVNGRMYRHAVSRRCRRCLKKQFKDTHAGTFDLEWHDEGWEERYAEQEKRNQEFINKKP